MDFWSRLIGGPFTEKRSAKPKQANDPQSRLVRFRRIWQIVLNICEKPRGNRPAEAESADLHQLKSCLDRIAQQLRDECRANPPHLCLQFAASNKIFAVVARAAALSRFEPVVAAATGVFSALVDSEEEDLLSSSAFAKSLMRMVKSALEDGKILISIDTETAILELLFTIAAKIRLQPEILPCWFAKKATVIDVDDVFTHEKEKSFVGNAQKEDFPLCYLLIDRVHHDGRIGDFARTGLLYVFEATGNSSELEEWIASSDLPTLMASGLGALYSQLSRELSLLHPDATLPPVLAMSDYSTQHPRATAESAFSQRHKSHMTTFLSYLVFWQDVLDHCKSAEVKQSLLDHFQILFLQQLLYPSLLQSSDTDAGSSVAVLTYMTAMLESLEYPELVHMMLRYLLAIPADRPTRGSSLQNSGNDAPSPPRSPQAIKRRQSLMLLTRPRDSDDLVAPELFSLTDLILNSTASSNHQTVFAALRLTSVLLVRQKSYSLGTFVKIQSAFQSTPTRTIGALEQEIERYSDLLASINGFANVDDIYAGICDDVRMAVESQTPFHSPLEGTTETFGSPNANSFELLSGNALIRSFNNLLRTFWSNSIDVNLALTQAITSLALCVELRLDSWLALDAPFQYPDPALPSRLTQGKPWQAHLSRNETEAWTTIYGVSEQPCWDDARGPLLWQTIYALTREIDHIRMSVSDFDQLVAGRKGMLQQTMVVQESPFSTHRFAGRTQLRSDFSEEQVFKANGGSLTSAHVPPAPALNSLSSNDRWVVSAMTDDMSAGDAYAQRSSNTSSIYQPPPPDVPSTTDVLIQKLTLPASVTVGTDRGTGTDDAESLPLGARIVSLNHLLTNVVVMQEFIMEIIAILQIRAAVLGKSEIRFA